MDHHWWLATGARKWGSSFLRASGAQGQKCLNASNLGVALLSAGKHHHHPLDLLITLGISVPTPKKNFRTAWTINNLIPRRSDILCREHYRCFFMFFQCFSAPASKRVIAHLRSGRTTTSTPYTSPGSVITAYLHTQSGVPWPRKDYYMVTPQATTFWGHKQIGSFEPPDRGDSVGRSVELARSVRGGCGGGGWRVRGAFFDCWSVGEEMIRKKGS